MTPLDDASTDAAQQDHRGLGLVTAFLPAPQIGLHGTADAASIGHSVSHGCIRLTNTDITTLAKLLPLGTPVHIT